MKNFKQELIRTLEFHSLSLQDIKCATVSKSVYTHIGFDDNDEIQEEKDFEYQLKINHTQQDFDLWLNSLDFNYELDEVEEDDTRSQEQIDYDYKNISLNLNGTIWLQNGDWLEWDYDDECIFEYWHLNKIKHIPNVLKYVSDNKFTHRHLEDVKELQARYAKLGYNYPLEQCANIWEDYSDGYAAGWLGMGNEEDIINFCKQNIQ